MCMEDIRIGRKLSVRSFIVVAPVGVPAKVIDGNPKRVFLSISTFGSDNVLIGSNDKPPTLSAGIWLHDNYTHLEMDIERYGAMVQQPIHAVALAANRNLYCTESILEDQ